MSDTGTPRTKLIFEKALLVAEIAKNGTVKQMMDMLLSAIYDDVGKLEHELAQTVEEGRRQMREEAATRYVMPNKNRPSAGEAWAAYREAVEDFRAAIRAIPL